MNQISQRILCSHKFSVLIILSFICFVTNCENIILTTKNGRIKGQSELDFFNKSYYSFQGIPFAKPPIGNLRFKAPEPIENWDGILDATTKGDACLQKSEGNENCLFLNIYTPELPKNPTELMPVMFWIHGGAFVSGSGNLYGPDFLLSENIVLVTINYRLNIFGFLSFDDVNLEIPGNAGLKDQIMALRWVKENIAIFGGNPEEITIFGESAGGASVHLLVLSSLAKGLFHRAIAQSGCGLNSWVFTPKRYKQFSKVFNMPENSTQSDILEVMMKTSGDELILAQERLFASENNPIGTAVVGPVIEHASDNAFISEHPEKLLSQGNFNQVPFITGFTSEEGAFFVNKFLPAFLPQNLTNSELLIPYDVDVEKGTENSSELGNKIKDFYYGNETAFNSTFRSLIDFLTDVLFTEKINKIIKMMAVTSTAPIYVYEFSYKSELNIMSKLLQIQIPVTAHADDIGYLLTTKLTPRSLSSSTALEGMRRLVKLWTAFAKAGDPNAHADDELINVFWKPVQKDAYNYLKIAPELELLKDPLHDRMEFWKNVYEEYKIRNVFDFS